MPSTLQTQPRQIRPISHQSTNDKVFELVRARLDAGTRVLDVGAGEGYFTKVLGDFLSGEQGVEPASLLAACDVTPEIFRYDAVRCDRIRPDGVLPYEDASFEIACSLEVVEHVEDQFFFCRELLRVLKPGGLLVLSTPNILNVNSRYRILHSGFATLFDPLPLSSVDVVHTSGHIHPVSYYYLAYALRRAGASSIDVAFDRFKRSALILLALFWPFLIFGGRAFHMRRRRKNPNAWRENLPLLRAMNSFRMLTSRSVIVTARKA